MVSANPLHPQQLGSYTVSRIIAQGQRTMVLAATSESHQAVAIKLALGLGERAKARFQREVDTCRGLHHEHVIQVYGSGVDNEGRPWYAMEYPGPITLGDILAKNQAGLPSDLPALIGYLSTNEAEQVAIEQRRSLPQQVALHLCLQIGHAVAYGHSRGVVHRDLKPDNILLRPDGSPVVCDFGTALDVQEERRLTQTGRIVGTLAYLAPECREQNAPVDERADVYALGIILQELLTGVAPFIAHVHAEVQAPVAPRSVQSLNRPLRLILSRATHADPNQRYRSMIAFTTDIDHFLKGEPVAARPENPILKVQAWCRTHIKSTLVMALSLLVLVVICLRLFILARFEASTWSHTIADLSFASSADLQRVRVTSGQWQFRDDGLGSAANSAGVAVLMAEQRYFGPLRAQCRLHIAHSSQCRAVLFVAGPHGEPLSGYRLVVDNDDHASLSLWRDRLLLAAVPFQWQADQQYDLELERVGASIQARIDGQDLLSYQDPIPLFGGDSGLALIGSGHDAYLFSELRIRGRSLPHVQSPEILGAQIFDTFIHGDMDTRKRLWPRLEQHVWERQHGHNKNSSIWLEAQALLCEGALHWLRLQPGVQVRGRALAERLPQLIAPLDWKWHNGWLSWQCVIHPQLPSTLRERALRELTVAAADLTLAQRRQWVFQLAALQGPGTAVLNDLLELLRPQDLSLVEQQLLAPLLLRP